MLKSDFSGVVTNTGAEVGQTVSPGQMVVNVADPTERDAVIDAPDAAAATLASGPRSRSPRARPRVRATGKVREIAPQADAATRTRRIKIALDDPPDEFRLGSTITAVAARRRAQGGAAAGLGDPHARRQGVRLDRRSRVVDRSRRARSRWRTPSADPVEVTAGLEPAMRVVTAGVHSLVEGQKVRLEQRAQN